MRQVMGQFCSGVVVVTAYGALGPMGFTCQSFTSLSLEPPLVSFNPSRTSTSWPRIRKQESFCINILSAGQKELSNAFARSGADKFKGVSWSSAPSGAPVLADVCAWADCQLWAEYDGGDHTIVVGAVNALGCDSDRWPLLFYQGGYGIDLIGSVEIPQNRSYAAGDG